MLQSVADTRNGESIRILLEHRFDGPAPRAVELLQQFLRLGADLEVVEPPSLRARLAGTAARLAAMYQVSPGTGTRSAPVPTRDSAMVTGQAEARTRSGWCS